MLKETVTGGLSVQTSVLYNYNYQTLPPAPSSRADGGRARGSASLQMDSSVSVE